MLPTPATCPWRFQDQLSIELIDEALKVNSEMKFSWYNRVGVRQLGDACLSQADGNRPAKDLFNTLLDKASMLNKGKYMDSHKETYD